MSFDDSSDDEDVMMSSKQSMEALIKGSRTKSKLDEWLNGIKAFEKARKLSSTIPLVFGSNKEVCLDFAILAKIVNA